MTAVGKQSLSHAQLLITGASARAAAFSSRRAGLRPVCLDLFGDEDLRQVAEVTVVASLQRALLRAAERLPALPVVYTGALENHPRVVERLARSHRLLGNSPDVLRRVRDPSRVCEALRRESLPALEVRRPNDPPPADGSWLLKPRRSAGGRGIGVWNEQARTSPTLRERHYFQRRAAGTPVSAVFVAGRLSCRPIGVTRQLVGEGELHAGPFAYCGSIGPLTLPDAMQQQILRTGRVVAAEFALRGLFGIDFVIDRNAARPVEVNPRYTASVEVLEHALGLSALRLHRSACESFDESRPQSDVEAERSIAAEFAGATPPGGSNANVGKAVLFADREFTSPPIPFERFGDALPEMADVPPAGTRFRPGQPLCTVFASGGTVAACLNALFERSRQVQRSMGG